MPIKNIYLTALIIHLDLFTAIKSIEAIKDRGKISTLFSAIRLATIFFHYGDNFTVGNTDYINQAKQHQKNSSQAVSFEAQTLTLDKPLEKTFGPRLVCTMPSGENNIYPLNQQKLIIGRSNEADINLLDPLVSRRHCVIEKKDNGFIARNVSTTNPLFVNDQAITEKRLYSGDQLKLGKISIAFISDKPEDVRPIEKKNVAQHKKPSLGLWTAGLLLFVFGGYLLYFHAYTPWKINRILYSVSKQIDIGVYQASQDTLKRLLKSDLSPEITHKAMELLAQTALAIAQQKSQNESLENAKAYLVAYLADYGAGSEAEFLWDRLDYYRLTIGHQLESSEKFQLALRQYAAIRENSLYFSEAQKAIKRIWLAHQNKRHQEQTLNQLFKEAEAHFRAKRYLTPVNQNAYAVYQAVLALEPDNKRAIERIEHIKAFYRKKGETYFKIGNWSRALSYFERYFFIDTEDSEIIDKISKCRQKLAEVKIPSVKSESDQIGKPKKQDEKREEIKRLLEESGTESSWIMKYLFEDQGSEGNSDTPW